MATAVVYAEVSRGACGGVEWRALRLRTPLPLGARALAHAHALLLTRPPPSPPPTSRARVSAAALSDAAAAVCVAASEAARSASASAAALLVVLRGSVHVDSSARLSATDAYTALPFTLLASDLALTLALAAASPPAPSTTTALSPVAPVEGTSASDAAYHAVLRAVRAELGAAVAGVLLLSVAPLTVLAPPSSPSVAPAPRTIAVSDAWRSVLGALCAEGARGGVVVAGRKDVGKSTFVRCLVNALLTEARVAGVLLLDADPGQGELQLPGLLSLHVVHAPLLGSPVLRAHAAPHTTCLARRVLGATTPKHAPLSYLRAVAQLAHVAHTCTHAHLPLVVNTCGWLQGRGAELLRQIVAHTRVAHVVMLHAPNRTPPPLEYPAPAPHVHTIPAASAASGGVTAMQVRTWAWRWHVLSAPAHWLALDVVGVRGLPAHVEEGGVHTTLLALNGAVVALLTHSEGEGEAEVAGLGLVRGVDAVLRRVLVQTPLSVAAMRRVHTLHATALDLLDQERGAGRAAKKRAQKLKERQQNEDDEDEEENEDADVDAEDDDEADVRTVAVGLNGRAMRRAYRSAHVLTQFSAHTRAFVERQKYLH